MEHMEQFMLQCIPNYFYCKKEISRNQCHFYEIKRRWSIKQRWPPTHQYLAHLVQRYQKLCSCCVCTCVCFSTAWPASRWFGIIIIFSLIMHLFVLQQLDLKLTGLNPLLCDSDGGGRASVSPCAFVFQVTHMQLQGKERCLNS